MLHLPHIRPDSLPLPKLPVVLAGLVLEAVGVQIHSIPLRDLQYWDFNPLHLHPDCKCI